MSATVTAYFQAVLLRRKFLILVSEVQLGWAFVGNFDITFHNFQPDSSNDGLSARHFMRATTYVI